MSKSGTISWSNQFPQAPRVSAANIIKHSPGPTKFAKNSIFSPINAFRKVICDQFIEKTVFYTNKYLSEAGKTPITSIEFVRPHNIGRHNELQYGVN